MRVGDNYEKGSVLLTTFDRLGREGVRAYKSIQQDTSMIVDDL